MSIIVRKECDIYGKIKILTYLYVYKSTYIITGIVVQLLVYIQREHVI